MYNRAMSVLGQIDHTKVLNVMSCLLFFRFTFEPVGFLVCVGFLGLFSKYRSTGTQH